MRREMGPASNSAPCNGEPSAPPTPHTRPTPTVTYEPEVSDSGGNGIGYERFAATAGAIITVQVALLISDTQATTSTVRGLLLLGIMLELLSILVAFSVLCIEDSHHLGLERTVTRNRHHRLASGVPIVLIVMGLLSLTGALILEAWQTSLSVAVVMACLLFSGAVFCLLGFVLRRQEGAVWAQSSSERYDHV